MLATFVELEFEDCILKFNLRLKNNKKERNECFHVLVVNSVLI